MEKLSIKKLLAENEELRARLSEAEQFIDAIKAGEVDAFAFVNKNQSEIFTLQSGDYPYRVLVENIKEGALNLSEDGLIVYSNTSFHEILQLSYENVIGKSIYDFIHPGSKETFTHLFRKGIAGQSQAEITLVAGSHTFPVHVSLTSLYPKVHTVAMIVTDLTANKQIEKELEAKKMLQNIFKQAPFALCVYEGKDYVISLANEFCCDIIGKTEIEVIGKKLFDLFPETAAQGFDKILSEIYSTGEPFYGTEYPLYFLKHGKNFHGYFDFVYQPLYDLANNVTGVISIAIDVTDKVLARKKIEESEERFKALADESPIFVFLIDPDPQAPVIYNNKTWLTYTGLNAEQAAGTGWNGIMHPDDIAKALGFYIPALTDKKPYFIPAARLLRHDGEYRWHSFKGNPRFLPSGEFNGYVGIGVDIHEQKLAEEALKESENQFSTLANSIQNLAWIADSEGWIYWYNQRWYDYTGTTLEEMQGWGWEKVHHPDHVKGVVDFVKEAWKKNEPFEITFPLRGTDGSYRWFLTRVFPVNDAEGNIVRWVGTNTDIDKQKSFSEQLEEKVKERTTQLNEVNANLEAKNQELQKMNKELEAFTYVSSHDLQEPLRKIQTFAGRIITNETEELSEKAKDYFTRMNNAATRMQTLIADLLSFSRLATTDRKFELTPLDKVVDEVKADLKEIIEEKNATIIASGLAELNIIPFQFRQLMQNLIGNSLKFSKPDVSPIITIKSKMLYGSALNNEKLLSEKLYCNISVRDNGIGFETKYSERIFEVFQRLHPKENYSGTGIGLAIVKKIVDYHNGIISVDSELGEGTQFDIYIPMKKS